MGRLIHWPAGLRISGMTPLSGPRAIGAGGSESLTGYIQTVAGVFGAWRWQLKCAPMKGEAFRRYRGTVAALHGGANALRVTFDDPDARDLLVPTPWTGNHARHVLFLRFDGADAATETLDESPNQHPLTFVGNAQLDTAQKVFGTSSLLLDGTGDEVTAPNHADFRVSAGQDFTIHCRARFAAISGFSTLISLWNAAANRRSWALFAINNGTDAINVVRFSFSLDGTAVTQIQSSSGVITTGVWYHIAVTRRAGVIRLFLDGVQVGTATDNSAFYVNTVDALAVGGSGTAVTNGHVDQVEMIKDLALWTAAFTPPVTPEVLSLQVPLVDGEPWQYQADWVAPSAVAALAASEIRLAATTWGHNLDVGDRIGFAPSHFGLYVVTQRIAAGRYRIWPPLRKAVTVNDWAHLRPVMAMRLENEDAASAGRAIDASDGAALTLIEVMHADAAAYFNDGGV